jgi:predicted aspartyl protease
MKLGTPTMTTIADMPAEIPCDRRRIISGLVALGVPSAFGVMMPQAAQAQTRVAQDADRVTVTGQTPIVTLQTWVDLYGRPTAEVMLNGRGPFKFVVDTGSNTSVLSTRVARSLELTPMPDAVVHGVTGTMIARFARISRIETGRSVSLNLPVAILDAPAFESLDGILGMDMFKDRRIKFNFARKTVEFESSRGRPPRLPVRVSVRLRQGLLIEAEGRVGAVRARCILDTGCDTTIVNTALLDAIKNAAVMRRRNASPPQIMGVTNQELNGIWVNLPEINLIGLKIRRLTAASADPPVFNLWGLSQTPAMLVGMDILTQVDTLIIDYGRREVELRMLANLVGGEVGVFRG